MLIEVRGSGQVNLPEKPLFSFDCTSNLSMWPAILVNLFNYAT